MCGRAARWWDEQIKDKINARRQIYRKVVNGREDLWGEYCRLRKEVKLLVIEKKLNIWNELVEKVNTDFDENRKEFWAFVGRKSKGKNKNKASLKSDTGLSLKSTRGKLEVLQRHYQLLSRMSVDSVFDADWKEEVESSCHITENSCSSKSTIPDPPYLSNSPTIPSLPPVLLFLRFLRHFAIKRESVTFSDKLL